MPNSRPLRVRLLSVALAAGLVMVAACSDDDEVEAGPGTDDVPAQVPEGEPTYSGTITDVSVFEPVTEDCIDPGDLDPDGAVSSDDPPICSDPETSPLGSVLVEAVPGEQTGDKISLRIDPAVPLWRDTASGPVEIAFEDLAEGDVVDAWVEGPVADSYPQQGRADAIVVTG